MQQDALVDPGTSSPPRHPPARNSGRSTPSPPSATADACSSSPRASAGNTASPVLPSNEFPARPPSPPAILRRASYFRFAVKFSALLYLVTNQRVAYWLAAPYVRTVHHETRDRSPASAQRATFYFFFPVTDKRTPPVSLPRATQAPVSSHASASQQSTPRQPPRLQSKSAPRSKSTEDHVFAQTPLYLVFIKTFY